MSKTSLDTYFLCLTLHLTLREQAAVFTSQGFLLTDGINTFFAETTGNYAKAALGLKLEVGMAVNVHLVVDARKWQTQQGEDRYENRVTITNIARWE